MPKPCKNLLGRFSPESPINSTKRPGDSTPKMVIAKNDPLLLISLKLSPLLFFVPYSKILIPQQNMSLMFENPSDLLYWGTMISNENHRYLCSEEI